ncbi:MAG: protein-export membrane protein SecD [Gammaproteobacteria bacterium RIFCSPHIGHO2_12_FULL_41_15]|nr:MAG: protein-export membrane protein SecD [Gammaproteobacteria bacterium RIFCSPHIGHO2_12_FULL_41_15]
MNRYPAWRYVLIVIMLIFGVLYSLPNLYPEDPAIQITTHDEAPFPSTIQNQMAAALRSQSLSYKSIAPENNTIMVRFTDTEDQLKAQDVLQASLGPNYSVALNLAPTTPKWLMAMGANPMKLGLDLRGGVHFLLQVDTNSMIKTRQTADMHSMGQQLRDKNFRYAGISPTSASGFVIRFRDTDTQRQAESFLQKNFPDYLFTTQQENNEPVIVGVMTQEALLQLSNYAVDQNLTILRTRVSELGIQEPVIQQQGADQISVDLPGIQDMARAKSLIGKMATIRLQLVDTQQDATAAAKTGVIPFGTQLFKDDNGQPILLNNQVILFGTSIINASPMVDDNGRPSVSIRVGGSVVTSFHKITGDNIGRPLAVVYVETQIEKRMVDGKIISKNVKVEKVINVSTINDALAHNFQITGLSSMQTAQNLALLLRSGAYSAQMNFVEERVIGPSLGKQNIDMGVTSLEIGSMAVVLFMILYYRLLGVIADLALILNIFFIVAILSVMGGTLSLPGIAGIVLTVGMAVDANVLINERIREELRNGVTPQAAIARGYDRAFSTIVDANVTTLIVAVILLALGSSQVQNLAETLIIGLITSMITAIFFTRGIVNLIYGGRKVDHLSIGIKIKKSARTAEKS